MALVERFRESQKREDRRAGGIIAMLFNINRGENTEGLDWYDFFPEHKEETEQTEEVMLEHMKLWSAATKALPS